MFAHAIGCEAVESVADASSANVYFGLLGGVYRSHYYLCCKLVAADYGARFGNDESAETVHADVLHVDISHERVQHFALGIAYIALQLRQKHHGTSHRHVLKHILLPVLAHGVSLRGEFCGEVALDD